MFQDCRRIWLVGNARTSGLLLTVFCSLLVAAYFSLTRSAPTLWPALLVFIGACAGFLLSRVQSHPRRLLGLIPLGAIGTLVALIWAVLLPPVSIGPALMLGFAAGLGIFVLGRTYLTAVPANSRCSAIISTIAAFCIVAISLVLIANALTKTQMMGDEEQQWLIVALAAAVAMIAGWLFFRDVLELFTELLIWPFYRIRGSGPGWQDFPSQGPTLVVANHSAWLDPVWIAKVLPRRLTPMMTSVFYDKPVLRWLMVHVVHAIRVEASGFRREAPELRQAVAALDRGECVVVFPEGRMRRRDDQLLHRFGQGIWHILRERPNTPVIPCWIEGGWGSYFSYCDGPPTRHKRFDRWRRIDVGVAKPRIIEPSVLEDHRATRIHLMQACLDTRQCLGLQSPLASTLVPMLDPGNNSGTTV